MADELLLEPRSEDTPEEAAMALLWAMDHMLSWNAERPRAGNHLFRSSTEMNEIWLAHGGADGDAPVVDFQNWMVVAMFLDAGEYSEAPGIQEVIKMDSTIEVRYQVIGRAWTMINPCSVISVPREDGEAVFVQVE